MYYIILINQLNYTDFKIIFSCYSVKFTSGIAGYVARTGNSVNIADAYQDPRFNELLALPRNSYEVDIQKHLNIMEN